MGQRPEIRSNEFPFDMAPWCIEKAEGIVKSLAYLVSFLDNTDDIPAQLREEVLFHIGPALWDATKLLSFSCGGDWATGDRDLITKKGYAGYEEVAVKYGLLDHVTELQKVTTRANKNERLLEFVTEMKKCLKGPKTNRTLAHELLRSCMERNSFLEKVSDLLEQVTFGEMAWERFVPLAVEQLSHLEDYLEDSDGSQTGKG